MAANIIDGLTELNRDFNQLPQRVRERLRPALRDAARPIRDDAKHRASWSTRIPGAITIRESATSRNAGVQIVVDSIKAPHARPYELGSARGAARLRHPVFGHRDRWVSQRTRPFLFPAMLAGQDQAIQRLSAAVAAAMP